MSRMEAYDAFLLYLSLKNHFTTKSYDFFKYQGKLKVPPATYEKRKDKWSFVKLRNTYTREEIQDLIVSNFLVKDSTYVNELFNDDSKGILMDYMKRQQSLTYIFTNDLDTLFSQVNEPDDIFKIVDGANPPILQAVYAKEISLETFVILNNMLGFFESFSKKLNDDFLWPKFRLKCEKYSPFIKYDKVKFKAILKEKLNEIRTTP